ncbi:hypothetical protein BvCmsF63A_02716 [Escherichia coli]|nr:hypothetical protein BvCmsF63A_02716 [Escherichia coli]
MLSVVESFIRMANYTLCDNYSFRIFIFRLSFNMAV